MGCRKEKKCREEVCLPKKKAQLCNCQKMTLPRVVELDATPSVILMINSGNNFSQERTVVIEAEISVVATDTVPATATFTLIVDGVALEPQNQIVINEIDNGINFGESQITVIRATLRVGPGVHIISLEGSANAPVEADPGEGGTTLSVCEKR